MTTRICGVCLRPPREGEEMRGVRLTEADLEGYPVTEPGLYSACSECVSAHRRRVAEQRGKLESQVSYNELC